MESTVTNPIIADWNKLQLGGTVQSFSFSTGYPCPHKGLAGLRGKSVDCVLELCSSTSSSSSDLQGLDESELCEGLQQACSLPEELGPYQQLSACTALSEAALRFQPHATSTSTSASPSAASTPMHSSQRHPDPSLSALTATMLSEWQRRSDAGLMRYDVSACPTRVLPGNWGFIAQLNEGRATKKRPTEIKVDKVCQPWDGSKFNFTKALTSEVLVRFEEQCGCGQPLYGPPACACLHKAQPQAGRSGSAAAAGTNAASSSRSTSPCSDSAASSATASSSHASASSTPRFVSSNPTSSSSSPSLVLVNVSPIDYGHVLLVPNVLHCQPQLLTTDAVLCGLHFARHIKHPHMRVGYNSLGAFATINHLHFQAYYLPQTLACERTSTRPLSSSTGEAASGSGVCVRALADYAVRGFVVELGTQPDDAAMMAAAHLIGRACARMQAADLPFNLFITDCGERVFIWPQRYAARQAAQQVPEEMLETGVNPAVFEIAGHLVLKRAQDYDCADEAWAWKLLEGVSLTEDEFKSATSLCWS
uniref:GDP-D-glucose phosphorylase 1 n=1 Tax=Chlamydomonas leiostraca TaxID=1034604 RepID=A0A7S0S0V6_9CHLO|mmetsp:Transcript_37419/g.94432  ORF Transcript_37419/g.94432 Transcript_37419/m.94432 type:complete len:535 (+) Transcript_37419:180-1784(+)